MFAGTPAAEMASEEAGATNEASLTVAKQSERPGMALPLCWTSTCTSCRKVHFFDDQPEEAGRGNRTGEIVIGSKNTTPSYLKNLCALFLHGGNLELLLCALFLQGANLELLCLHLTSLQLNHLHKLPRECDSQRKAVMGCR